jgi:hypothetical protein
MKKFVLALALVVTATTVNARTSAKDCENYGDIVGSMQSIRNKGGSIDLAFSNLENLKSSRNPESREYGNSLTDIARWMWTKPQGNMDRDHAVDFGTAVCVKKYR